MAEQTEYRLIIDANQNGIGFKLKELWEYRELLYFLTWRQIIVRYKQTAVGVAWALIQPIASMVVMTIVFSVILKVDTGDIPYPVFVLSGLIYWRYFSAGLTGAGQSLVNNSALVSKVYFPRLIIPISSTLSPIIDFLLSFIILLIVMILFNTPIPPQIILMPAFAGLAFLTALSVSLWFSALNVRYRDVNHIIPFVLQIWMYITPIMYPLSTVPEGIIRTIYRLNPMVGVIEGAQWAMIDSAAPDGGTLLLNFIGVVLLLLGGIIFFNRMERSFADFI
ncbi:MAG: ABC transporter permease [Chloroflexi bacterium]|nr:MAG: ABC transporter permease [Chloroflexota bacterium]